MNNNPNPYNFPDQQGQQSNIPPPPPSPEAQVGVRSMQSDLESIKQSGGEAPQSQIINAPELATMGQQPEASPQTTTPPPTFTPSSEPQPSPEVPPDHESSPAKSSFSLKTILLIVGGLILAGAIGYGAYYLVSNLTSTPEISVPTTTNLPTAPIPTSTPATTTTVPETPVIPPLVHQSLILSPTKTESLLISLPDASFKSVIASSSEEKLLVGSVKDLSFVNASGTSLESTDILNAYFSSKSTALSAFFEKDFTSWLYYDKTGGAKLGLILQLKSSAAFEQASSSVGAILESSTSEISKFFVSNPAVPAKIAFDDGVVESTPVRFLAYSVKNSDVFEYGWYNRSGTHYLFMITSYNQAVDIVKKLKALPPLTQGQTSTSTSAGTTTQP